MLARSRFTHRETLDHLMNDALHLENAYVVTSPAYGYEVLLTALLCHQAVLVLLSMPSRSLIHFKSCRQLFCHIPCHLQFVRIMASQPQFGDAKTHQG